MLNVPEIGEHYKILAFEKNENPQNIMIVYTQLDRQCQLVKRDGKPLIDFYWLMDGRKFKPVNPLIKEAVRGRLELINARDAQFELRVNDLNDLKEVGGNTNLTVKVEKKNGVCSVRSYFPDAKDSGREILVNSIYSESKKIFLPPFRKLVAVTIRGTAPLSGEAVERKFLAK